MPNIDSDRIEHPVIFLSSYVEINSIGHEAGHFMHNLSNRKIYRQLLDRRSKMPEAPINLPQILIESVANYSELIFNNRGKFRSTNPLQNPQFSLAELVGLKINIPYELANKVRVFYYFLDERVKKMKVVA